jgi:hypothetical protein
VATTGSYPGGPIGDRWQTGHREPTYHREVNRYTVTIGQHVQTVQALSFQDAAEKVRSDLADVTAAVADAHGTVLQVPPK